MNIRTAVEHHLAGRLPQAEALYRQMLQPEPNRPDALYCLGVMAAQTGREDAAIYFVLKAIDASPCNPVYYNTLGDALKDKSRLDEAAARYRQAPADKPDYAEVHNDLGVALMASGSLDEAVGSFRQALAFKSGYAEAWNNLGAAFENQRKPEQALACYHQALALKPDYAKALFNVGTAHFVKKEFAQALPWYQDSLAADPHQVEAHQNVASILLDARRPEEAQRHRDPAYRRQAVFVETAPSVVRTVLVLWAAGRGNVPIRYLLPPATNTRIVWMMEYATAEQERSLLQYDLVFNAIGDQDVAGPTAAPVARFLRGCGKPVLNLSAAVARTARDRIPALFAPIAGVLAPVTLRVDTGALKDRLLGLPGLRLPLLLRPGGSHGGEHLVKRESADGLRDLRARNTEDYYASNYHDYRSGDGRYRKYRMVFVDRRPYAYHLAIGEHWLVHYETAGMLGASWKTAEEQVFLEHTAAAIGAQAMAAVKAIGRALDLDFCGLDFSVLRDGRALVFDASATMLVHAEDEHGVLAFKNPHVARIVGAFDARLRRAASGRPDA